MITLIFDGTNHKMDISTNPSAPFLGLDAESDTQNNLDKCSLMDDPYLKYVRETEGETV